MVKSMYASIAGLKTHQSKLDVISHNIANVNTWGFKSRSANFADAVYQNSIQGGGGNTSRGGSGGMNTSQLGFGVNMASISTDFTTGSWSPTGNGLHCMINGPSFFIVSSMKPGQTNVEGDNALKNNGFSLTRVGIFSIDNNGYLVDDQGNYVYGYTQENTAYDPDNADADNNNPFLTTSLSTISLENAKDAEGNSIPDNVTIQSYTISKDGIIVGIGDDEVPYTLGQIAVASVENVNGLEQDEGYLYTIGDNAGTATATLAGSNTVGKILSGYLEMANVDLATEIANMITTQRGYQANTKIVTVTDEMLEQLVNMKR